MGEEEKKIALKKIESLKHEIGKVIVGQHELIDAFLLSILTGGHLLLEGVPGVAKTLAANTFAKCVSCVFKRVQFTPDLLPADLIGTTIYDHKEGRFFVEKGPIFTQFLLADEINRAPSKVQSALLEIMQEKQVTIGKETFKIFEPFIVIATQNPIEQEGTYPLAEAQSDRFIMKVKIGYPSREEEQEIIKRMAKSTPSLDVSPILEPSELLALRKLVDEIYIDDKIVAYILDIVAATRVPADYGLDCAPLLVYGASPRASIALSLVSKARALMEGRAFVTPEDIQSLVLPILCHRIRLSYEAEAENVTAEELVARILTAIELP